MQIYVDEKEFFRMKAQDREHSQRVINERNQLKSTVHSRRLARILQPNPPKPTVIKKAAPLTELRQERLKYAGGPTGEEMEGQL